jgi:hypothetical protein
MGQLFNRPQKPFTIGRIKGAAIYGSPFIRQQQCRVPAAPDQDRQANQAGYE